MPIKVVRVTPAQVAAARLRITLDQRQGQPTPDAVRRIAEAVPLADLVAAGDIEDITPAPPRRRGASRPNPR